MLNTRVQRTTRKRGFNREFEQTGTKQRGSHMRLGLILIFIAVPVIELALLIQLGSWLGFWPTIGLIVLTAFIGTAVLRQQGLETMNRMSAEMSRGEPPVEPLIDGVFIVVAGAFLLTPGVLTDAVGLLLLIPPIRRVIRRWGYQQLMRNRNFDFHVHTSTGSVDPGSPSSQRGGFDERRSKPRSQDSGPVIDGEYERLGDRTIDPKRSGRTRK